MGNATSEIAYSREKQISLNQELWNNERKVEINRIFGNDLRKDIRNNKVKNYQKQHDDFLTKLEKEKFEREGKYEKENKIRKKIFNDDYYFKKYVSNVQSQIAEENLNSSIDNILNVNKKENLGTLPKLNRHKSVDFKCRLWKKN